MSASQKIRRLELLRRQYLIWQDFSENNKSALPHEFLFQILLNDKLDISGNPSESWVLAAARENVPVFVPGWEDSTLGNIFASHVIQSKLNPSTVKVVYTT